MQLVSEIFIKFECVYGRMGGQRLESHHISSPGELKLPTPITLSLVAIYNSCKQVMPFLVWKKNLSIYKTQFEKISSLLLIQTILVKPPIQLYKYMYQPLILSLVVIYNSCKQVSVLSCVEKNLSSYRTQFEKIRACF